MNHFYGSLVLAFQTPPTRRATMSHVSSVEFERQGQGIRRNRSCEKCSLKKNSEWSGFSFPISTGSDSGAIVSNSTPISDFCTRMELDSDRAEQGTSLADVGSMIATASSSSSVRGLQSRAGFRVVSSSNVVVSASRQRSAVSQVRRGPSSQAVASSSFSAKHRHGRLREHYVYSYVLSDGLRSVARRNASIRHPSYHHQVGFWFEDEESLRLYLHQAI